MKYQLPCAVLKFEDIQRPHDAALEQFITCHDSHAFAKLNLGVGNLDGRGVWICKNSTPAFQDQPAS